MWIAGTSNVNELKFHLLRILSITLTRFTQNTVADLINIKRAFVRCLLVFTVFFFLGHYYSCESLPGCFCCFVPWGINKDRKSRIFKQIPYHELFADVFSIHSGEPFSLFNIKLSSSILHVQEVQFFFYRKFKKTNIFWKELSSSKHQEYKI